SSSREIRSPSRLRGSGISRTPWWPVPRAPIQRSSQVGVAASRDGRIAVLDDDPTGVQTLSRVRVLLDWGENRVSRALAHAESIHLLTNSRAFSGQDARA